MKKTIYKFDFCKYAAIVIGIFFVLYLFKVIPEDWANGLAIGAFIFGIKLVKEEK